MSSDTSDPPTGNNGMPATPGCPSSDTLATPPSGPPPTSRESEMPGEFPELTTQTPEVAPTPTSAPKGTEEGPRPASTVTRVARRSSQRLVLKQNRSRVEAPATPPEPKIRSSQGKLKRSAARAAVANVSAIAAGHALKDKPQPPKKKATASKKKLVAPRRGQVDQPPAPVVYPTHQTGVPAGQHVQPDMQQAVQAAQPSEMGSTGIAVNAHTGALYGMYGYRMAVPPGYAPYGQHGGQAFVGQALYYGGPGVAPPPHAAAPAPQQPYVQPAPQQQYVQPAPQQQYVQPAPQQQYVQPAPHQQQLIPPPAQQQQLAPPPAQQQQQFITPVQQQLAPPADQPQQLAPPVPQQQQHGLPPAQPQQLAPPGSQQQFAPPSPAGEHYELDDLMEEEMEEEEDATPTNDYDEEFMEDDTEQEPPWKHTAGYEGEAEDEDEELVGSGSEFEIDQELDDLVDSMDSPTQDKGKKTQFRTGSNGQLSYHILDQINAMAAESRKNNKTIFSLFEKLDKRMSAIEQGTAAPRAVVPLSQKKQRSRAPKPSRSKTARIELPPRPDGRPYTEEEMEAAIAVEREYLNRASMVVRLHFKKMLGVRSFAEMAEKCPPLTEEQIAAYHRSPTNTDFFTPDTFRPDFSQSWSKFPYNIEARDYFIRHLLHALAGGAYHKEKLTFPERYKTPYHLGAALDAHMEHCRARIRKVNDPPSSGDEELEAKAARARGRRTTLHDQRWAVVEDHEYEEHKLLLSKFDPANHSEDETDVEGPRRRSRANRFRIILSEWMSTGLRGLLRSFDEEYIDDWEMSPKKRRKGGSTPRERVIPTPLLSTLGTPAVGLWRNCYNEAWLQTLRPHDLRDLRIQPGTYDFNSHKKRRPEFLQGSSQG